MAELALWQKANLGGFTHLLLLFIHSWVLYGSEGSWEEAVLQKPAADLPLGLAMLTAASQ